MISVAEYVSRTFNDDVRECANAWGVSSSIIYRYMKNDSVFVAWIGGKPKLCNIKLDLPALPYNLRFDLHHPYMLMFQFDSQEYYVSTLYGLDSELQYRLNSLGDLPPNLDISFEHSEDTGLHFLRFSDEFEFVYSDGGAFWLNPGCKSYAVRSVDDDKGPVRWESFSQAVEIAKRDSLRVYFGDACLFRGDV